MKPNTNPPKIGRYTKIGGPPKNPKEEQLSCENYSNSECKIQNTVIKNTSKQNKYPRLYKSTPKI